ncbi:unnamed protein product, partial [Bubo scandiacus]
DLIDTVSPSQQSILLIYTPQIRLQVTSLGLIISICATATFNYSKTECGWWRQTQISQEAHG